MNGNQKLSWLNASLTSAVRAFRKGMKTFSSNLHKSNCKFEYVPAPGGKFRVSVTADLTKKISFLFSQKWDCWDAVLSFSKELIVFSRYTEMSVRQIEPLAFCRTRFKDWMTGNTSCNIRIAAKNLFDISLKILYAFGSLIFYSHKLKVQIIFVYTHHKDF